MIYKYNILAYFALSIALSIILYIIVALSIIFNLFVILSIDKSFRIDFIYNAGYFVVTIEKIK
jgi:hypothetical protein